MVVESLRHPLTSLPCQWWSSHQNEIFYSAHTLLLGNGPFRASSFALREVSECYRCYCHFIVTVKAHYALLSYFDSLALPTCLIFTLNPEQSSH